MKSFNVGKPRILIAIPAKDEEETIGCILEALNNLYPNVTKLVIDDGSIDRTAEIAVINKARVVSHGKNRGVAMAIQTARKFAIIEDYDILVFVDADGQHDPRSVERILKPLIAGEADFVIGSRELGVYIGKENLLFKLGRKVCSVLVSIITGKRIYDATSGFKGWNRRVIEYLDMIFKHHKTLLHKGTVNDVEEILLCLMAGFKVLEVPVIMHARSHGRSKCYTPNELLKFLLHLIRAVVNILALRWPWYICQHIAYLEG